LKIETAVPEIIHQYIPILMFLAVALVVSCGMLLLPFIVAPRKPDKEKLSTYECGFDPVGSPWRKFDVRFYLVGILFIIFDLEIAFLLPWAMNIKTISVVSFFSAVIFLFILFVGFVYEWKKGALDWE
jgi:NADH-quinone oxidoreductase subunit A